MGSSVQLLAEFLSDCSAAINACEKGGNCSRYDMTYSDEEIMLNAELAKPALGDVFACSGKVASSCSEAVEVACSADIC